MGHSMRQGLELANGRFDKGGGGSSETLLKARISELESEIADLRRSVAHGPTKDGGVDDSGRLILLKEMEAMRETSDQMKRMLTRAEADAGSAASEIAMLKAELENQRAGKQSLRNQVLDTEKAQAMWGREAASELDAIMFANKGLQQELASLQRKMQDKQDSLHHEVSSVTWLWVIAL